TARERDDPTPARLAQRCLDAIEGQRGALTAAAIRLLAQRRPEGTVRVLLANAPLAEDEAVLEECKAALARLAYRSANGQADPVLLRGLEDERGLVRALAIEALCQNGVAEPRSVLRRLLQDPVAGVRLRAGLALAEVRDEHAVLPLMQLLA